ncbi:MAG: hypothetical protein ISS57_10730 [Anaerolineales bacterium]|nr:hypothetical protein [Anaerolineales bacterium]
MMNKGYLKLLCIQLAVVIFLTACGSDQAVDPSPETIDYSTPRATVIATDELFRTSGEGSGVAEKTFIINETTRIRVNWDQSSEDLFVLVIFREDSESINRVTFEYIVGPSSGYGDFDFEPGEYVLEIEEGDGPWDVWLQEVTNEGG